MAKIEGGGMVCMTRQAMLRKLAKRQKMLEEYLKKLRRRRGEKTPVCRPSR
ncbi:hypothetical protein [Desulfovirgula thermocuniculi]|uniref:hypothetical protein n=1 Tax=Desulfovirgula thermocuniculi TaxID=348842 RepID=UPI0012EB904B|nr:hypothetical protein [Desulfovirgula thermocuniculi]